MLPKATGVFGLSFVYVQDNATPNTAPETVAFLAQQDMEVKDWPDMNLSKHVWDPTGVWLRDMDTPPPPPACHAVCVLFSPPKGGPQVINGVVTWV